MFGSDEDNKATEQRASLLGEDADCTAERKRGLTGFQTGVSMVKCALGAGSFTLPAAFLNGGLYLSFAMLVFCGGLAGYTLNLLAHCERRVSALCSSPEEKESGFVETSDPTRPPRRKLTYPELGREAFPELSLTTSSGTVYNALEMIIFGGIVATSVGVGAAYIDFITATLADLLATWGASDINRVETLFIILPFVLFLAYLRDVSALAHGAVLGNIAVIVGIATVVVAGFQENGDEATMDVPAARIRTLPGFFGPAAFLFAIHTVILPIVQSMEKEENFVKVVASSYSVMTVGNAVFGGLCLIIFYNSSCDAEGVDDDYTGPCPNVLDSLSGSSAVDAVRIVLCIDLLFTIPLVLIGGREILERGLLHALELERKSKAEYRACIALRTVIVGATIALAFGVPDFGNAVSLVGGFCNCLTAFIVPPIIHIKLMDDPKSLEGAAHAGIVVFGLVALVVTTTYTIQGIIASA